MIGHLKRCKCPVFNDNVKVGQGDIIHIIKTDLQRSIDPSGPISFKRLVSDMGIGRLDGFSGTGKKRQKHPGAEPFEP